MGDRQGVGTGAGGAKRFVFLVQVSPVILLCFAPGFATILTQIWPSLFKEIAALVPSPCFTGSGSWDCCVPRVTLDFFGMCLVLVLRLTT